MAHINLVKLFILKLSSIDFTNNSFLKKKKNSYLK